MECLLLPTITDHPSTAGFPAFRYSRLPQSTYRVLPMALTCSS